MKNIAMALALAGTIASYGGELPVLQKESPKSDFEIVTNQLIKAESFEQFYKMCGECKFFSAWIYYRTQRPDLADLYAEADRVFAAKGYRTNGTAIKSFPRMSAISRALFGTSTNTAIYATSLKYGCDAYAHQISQFATADEFVDCINDCLGGGNTGSISLLNSYKKEFQMKYGLKLVKRMLYRHGKSFVTKDDGVNPCEAMMTRLTTSLNAPRMAGFNEWLAEVGVTSRVSLDFLPSNEQIEKMKMDILVGEVAPTSKNLYILNVGLGNDKYNEFIKRFNGDDK